MDRFLILNPELSKALAMHRFAVMAEVALAEVVVRQKVAGEPDALSWHQVDSGAECRVLSKANLLLNT